MDCVNILINNSAPVNQKDMVLINLRYKFIPTLWIHLTTAFLAGTHGNRVSTLFYVPPIDFPLIIKVGLNPAG